LSFIVHPRDYENGAEFVYINPFSCSRYVHIHLTIPYSRKDSLLIVGDDAQSGMKRNVMRVTFVGVEQYDSFPPCGSGVASIADE
jgi:hypothetical protein